jgi:hypothetical protein
MAQHWEFNVQQNTAKRAALFQNLAQLNVTNPKIAETWFS